MALYLKNEGYETLVCYNGQEALEQIQAGPVDLAILDVMLPEISGFELCRRIRGEVPVPGDYAHRQRGGAGQDQRPVPGGGRLRHQALPSPGAGGPGEGPAAAVQALQRGIFTERASHLRGPGHRRGDPSGLSQRRAPVPDATEFSLLAALCESKGKVVSSEELFRRVWGEGYYTKDNNTITVHIRHLREKLGDSFERPKYIKTVWGVGYEMDA